MLGLLFLVLRRQRETDKAGGTGKKKLALKPSGIVAVAAGALTIVWAWYFVISPKLELPLMRSGFRMVVFSVIIMIMVLFFSKGLMGDKELPDLFHRRKAQKIIKTRGGDAK